MAKGSAFMQMSFISKYQLRVANPLRWSVQIYLMPQLPLCIFKVDLKVNCATNLATDISKSHKGDISFFLQF